MRTRVQQLKVLVAMYEAARKSRDFGKPQPWRGDRRPSGELPRRAYSVDGYDPAVMSSRFAAAQVSGCALGKSACEIGIIEIRKSGEGGAIGDPHSGAGHLDEPILAQPAEHPIDVRNAEAEHIGELRLGERQIERAAIAQADGGESCGHLQQEMSQALIGAAPADIREVLAEHGGLTGDGAEHRERDPRVVAEDGGDIREADDVYDGVAECAHGIKSRLEEVCGVADGVAGYGDVERLAAAVHQDPIAQRKPLREHEEAVVGAAVDDDVATTRDGAGRRPETLERRCLGVRKVRLVGEIGAQLREKRELFEIRDGHRPLPLALGNKKALTLGDRVLRVNTYFPGWPDGAGR